MRLDVSLTNTQPNSAINAHLRGAVPGGGVFLLPPAAAAAALLPSGGVLPRLLPPRGGVALLPPADAAVLPSGGVARREGAGERSLPGGPTEPFRRLAGCWLISCCRQQGVVVLRV
jgi:hypothetical protein